MSEAQKVMAKVIGAHRSYYNHGDDHDRCTGCRWKGHAGDEHDTHIAAKIDEAFGGITPETRQSPMFYNTDEMVPSRLLTGPDMVPRREMRFVTRRRWVSASAEVGLDV